MGFSISLFFFSISHSLILGDNLQKCISKCGSVLPRLYSCITYSIRQSEDCWILSWERQCAEVIFRTWDKKNFIRVMSAWLSPPFFNFIAELSGSTLAKSLMPHFVWTWRVKLPPLAPWQLWFFFELDKSSTLKWWSCVLKNCPNLRPQWLYKSVCDWEGSMQQFWMKSVSVMHSGQFKTVTSSHWNLILANLKQDQVKT